MALLSSDNKLHVEREKIDIGDILNDVSCGADFYSLDVSVSSPKDIFSEKKRKAWDNSIEARCDFARKIRITRRSDVFFISIWQKSLYGRTLTEIKADDKMIPFFADNVSMLIKDVIGENLSLGDWAICTTPKRRHKERNFATLISMLIADKLGITFYEDVAFCHSKQRMNAVFTLNVMPREHNLIIFDDFVTTGQTLHSMYVLLHERKNIVFFTGINNIL